MLTLDALRAWGANVEEGMTRCLNMEAFYLNLVRKAMDDPHFASLAESAAAKDLGRAFEDAHALKGALSNLALTPLCEPILEITELLRAHADADYGPLLAKIAERRESLMALF